MGNRRSVPQESRSLQLLSNGALAACTSSDAVANSNGS